MSKTEAVARLGGWGLLSSLSIIVIYEGRGQIDLSNGVVQIYTCVLES